MRTIVLVGLYLSAIVIANLSVAYYGPSVAIINAFLFIGLDLTTRDKLHEAWKGPKLPVLMGILIVTGSLLSWLLNADAGPIALASFVAFASSQIVDAVIYQALRHSPKWQQINGSNVVSAGVDSLVFPYLAFGGWMPMIVVGQFVAKVFGGAVWSVVLGLNKGELPE